MQYEFAPLEGITGYIYRNAHHACFPSMDRYYTPFITPKKGKSFTTREWNDIAAEHNQNIAVVPQILTNQAEGFCKVAGMLKEQGYEEVNLNLGCPSGTVTAKGKGAGFLGKPDGSCKKVIKILHFFDFQGVFLAKVHRLLYNNSANFSRNRIECDCRWNRRKKDYERCTQRGG